VLQAYSDRTFDNRSKALDCSLAGIGLEYAPLNAPPSNDLIAELSGSGHVFLRDEDMRRRLEALAPLSDWAAFSESWERLEVDAYMADRGRYRRRRHAVFQATAQGFVRQPHQPHFQTVDYNPLHGGIERWFEPVEESIGRGASLTTILEFCRRRFSALEPAVASWKVEVHQFRIEARAGEPGLPTPEGMHRDGVDYVLVLMIRRRNIASGTTTIHAPDGRRLGAFTLTEPFDAVLVNDHRVYHGVTPVTPLDPAQPACRDVLVVTFRRS